MKEAPIEAFDRVSARKTHPTFALCEKSDNDLFSQIRYNHSHVLYGLLQTKPACVYTLRERYHNFVLPDNSFTLLNCNFINRILYKNTNVVTLK